MKLVEVESNHSISWRFSASSAQQKTTMSYGGSCFRSYINRFISADSIVPNPTHPQNYNRYSYVLNNPLRYKDATGHCGADISEDLTNQCETLRGSLHQQYGVNIDGVWTLAEMLVLQLGLHDLELGMGGIEYFLAAFSGTALARERVWQSPDQWDATTNLAGRVTFYNASFSLGQDWGRWAVIHEFGHVWDLMGIGDWDTSIGSILHTGLELLTRPSNLMDLLPEDGRVSDYADLSRSEDFAESWASYFFQGSWENMAQVPERVNRVPADESRDMFIGLQVSLWQQRVNQFNFALAHPILQALSNTPSFP